MKIDWTNAASLFINGEWRDIVQAVADLPDGATFRTTDIPCNNESTRYNALCYLFKNGYISRSGRGYIKAPWGACSDYLAMPTDDPRMAILVPAFDYTPKMHPDPVERVRVYLLYAGIPAHAAVVAASCGMSTPEATRVLNKLCSKSLCRKSGKHYLLTPQGVNLGREMPV